MKPKAFDAYPYVFVECGQCGSYHHRDLPGMVDCRDDRYRFTAEDLDNHFGDAKWEEIPLEEQMDAEARGERT